MCAINPVHKKRFVIDVYTSEKISKKKFLKDVREIILGVELDINTTTKYRWHVKETTQQAD